MTNENEFRIIIELIARKVFGDDGIRKIVVKNKRDPASYIAGYNACDGTRSVTELAKLIGVRQPTLTPILKAWVAEGILYDVGSESKPVYKKLFTIK